MSQQIMDKMTFNIIERERERVRIGIALIKPKTSKRTYTKDSSCAIAQMVSNPMNLLSSFSAYTANMFIIGYQVIMYIVSIG